MGRAPCCVKENVKRGTWSVEEDAKLKSFIEQNGNGGNWSTLPSKAGLKRCGKSCRWSLIAAQLPGRTDNDIKNYWNTRLKKKLSGGRSVSCNRQLDPFQMCGDIFIHVGCMQRRVNMQNPGEVRFGARENMFHRQQSSYHSSSKQQTEYQIRGPGQQDPNTFVEQNIHQPDEVLNPFSQLKKLLQQLSETEDGLKGIIVKGKSTSSDP
ncbi:hypothetical protein R1flu_001920 [Riccia fluitans]|uniref:Uncharacterized protein n=1 Tax=Riccia fluitans TaxID=41844 RepID=A0ABD1Y4T1_9MARC